MLTKLNFFKWLFIALGIFFVFANPFLRQAFLWILPLGRGIDDLIEAVAILIIGVLLAGRGYAKWKTMQDFRVVNRKSNTKLKQYVLVVLTVLLALVIPPAGSALWSMFFFAIPITDPTVFIEMGIAFIIVIVGWNLIGYFDKRKRIK